MNTLNKINKSKNDISKIENNPNLKFSNICEEQTHLELDIACILKYAFESVDNMGDHIGTQEVNQLIEKVRLTDNIFNRTRYAIKMLTLIHSDLAFRFYENQKSLQKQLKEITFQVKESKELKSGEYGLITELMDDLN